MFYTNVNWLAVVLAAVAGMAVGFLWYSPFLFGKTWMKLSGMTDAKMKAAKKKGMGGTYAVSFFGMLVMSYVLAVILNLTGSTTIAAASKIAVWVWLGFIATVQLGTILWEGKSVYLYLLNVLHYLVALVTMSVALILV